MKRDLRLRVMQWFWFTPDRVMDKYSRTESWDRMWNSYDFVQNKIVAPGLCRIYGHKPERDHCNRPEHDFCLFCHKSMPNSYDVTKDKDFS